MKLSLFNKSTTSVSIAALIIAGSVLVSRVLGLMRDRILAGMFGAGAELDIYFSAFRIPDLIYSIIIGGAVSSAFIPVFISYFSKNKDEAWHIAQSFFYIAFLGLVLISALVFFLMPHLIPYVVPGFDLENISITVTMSRIMLLSPFFLGLSAIFSGILHSFRKFFIYSLAPIFYNIGIIIGAVWFTKYLGIQGLAWGVALGAGMHILVQAPISFKSGFKLMPFKKLYHPAIPRILKLMAPRAIGLAAYQVNLWVITAIASTLAVGSLTIFTLANNLHYLPIGLIGTSYAVAVFPSLSHSISTKNYQKYLKEFSKTFRSVLFLIFPVSIMFFVLRAQIVRVVLGTGEFGWESTRLTAAALGAFSVGMVAYALIPIISRAFYAQENTRTPVIANTIGMGVNILLSVLLVYVLFPKDGLLNFIGSTLKVGDLSNTAVIGLPLAFSISGIVSLFLLFIAFFKDPKNVSIMSELVVSFFRITLASFFAGIFGWLMLRVFVYVSTIDTFIRVLGQSIFSLFAAAIVYIFIAHIFKFEEFNMLISFLRTKFRKDKIPQSGQIDHMDGFTSD